MTPRLRLLTAALLPILSLAGCSDGAPNSDEPWAQASAAEPIIAPGGLTDPRIRGVWQSRGYGWVLDIDDAGITRYQAGAACYAPQRGETSLSEMDSVSYRLFREVDPETVVILQLLEGDTQVVFDRLESLPAHCTKAPDTSPTGVVEAFLDHFESHYAFFDRRPPGHEERAARLRAQITEGMDEAALWDALGSYMEGLSDSHTKLIGEVEGEGRRIADGQGITLPRMRGSEGGEGAWLFGLIGQTLNELGETARHEANDRIVWGVIDGRIGYIQIFVMGGFSDNSNFASAAWAEAEMAELNRVLDEALTAFADLDAVIIDLSNNRGGWDQVAKALPARFTDEAFTAFTTQARGSGLAPFAHVIEPASGPRFTGPTYVMTSDVTVSGGELATLAFRQLPNVTQVGSTTRGAFSTPLAKPLPNGWLLELSNEVFAAPDGSVFEETGLEPEVEIEIYPADDPIGGHWRAVEQIADIALGSAN